MTEQTVDLETWPRLAQYRHFRAYDRPHYAVTARLDVTRLMETRKPQGVSPYRACLFAIGAGIHAVPELRMRFVAERVLIYDTITLSMTVPQQDGAFNFAYVPFVPEFARFDAVATDRIEAARQRDAFEPHLGTRHDVAYLSCLPWLDFTAIDNALPGPDDCIPRVSWGRFVQEGSRWRMAMAIQVHHALVDGLQIGGYFAGVQEALDAL